MATRTKKSLKGQLDYTLIPASGREMGRVVPLGIDYTQTAADQLPVCNHAPNTHSKSNKTTDEREVQTFVHQNFQELGETVGLISYSKISRKWAKQLDSSLTPKFPGNWRNSWTRLLLQISRKWAKQLPTNQYAIHVINYTLQEKKWSKSIKK